MPLNLKKKMSVVCQIQKNLELALSVVVGSLHGVKSNAVNQLRKEAREYDVNIKVVSNTLLCRAVTGTPFEALSKFFVGQSIVAFSKHKPNDAARVFVGFAKNYADFKIKGAFFDGNVLQSDQVSVLSNLPNYKESMCQLIFILQLSSVGVLIRILKLLSRKDK